MFKSDRHTTDISDTDLVLSIGPVSTRHAVAESESHSEGTHFLLRAVHSCANKPEVTFKAAWV